MNPTVSVIVPANNAARTIHETIESVLSQSFADLELIVVDDGSTDETKNVVLEYRSKDDRVKYLWQHNAGPSAARNKGLDMSTGRYVSIVDADDLWNKEKLSKQLARMGSDDDLIALTGIQRFHVINGTPVWGEITLPPAPQNDRYDVFSTLLLSNFQMVLINTGLLPGTLTKKLGGWNSDMRLAEDWEFWIRASRQCRFKTIDEPLSYYRKHAESVTSRQDLFTVLKTHEHIIEGQCRQGFITKKEFQRALISRQIETCGFFLYQRELGKAIRVLRKAFDSTQGWIDRRVWMRAAEILRLAWHNLVMGDMRTT